MIHPFCRTTHRAPSRRRLAPVFRSKTGHRPRGTAPASVRSRGRRSSDRRRPSSTGALTAEVMGASSRQASAGRPFADHILRVSAWLTRLGARAVGLDPRWKQLASARRFQQEFSEEFALVGAIAEAVPFPDASFDLVISEYGAAIWSDPHLWVPEAARVLRPGGELIMLGNSSLLVLCVDDEAATLASSTLLRAQHGTGRSGPDDAPGSRPPRVGRAARDATERCHPDEVERGAKGSQLLDDGRHVMAHDEHGRLIHLTAEGERIVPRSGRRPPRGRQRHALAAATEHPSAPGLRPRSLDSHPRDRRRLTRRRR